MYLYRCYSCVIYLIVYLQVADDWSYVSMIIDRIFLYIYTLAISIGTTAILLSSPVLWEPEGFHPTPAPEQVIEISSTVVTEAYPE